MSEFQIKNVLVNLRERIERKASRTLKNTLAVVFNNGIRAYWCDFENFGDQITPALLKFYGFTPIHSAPAPAQIISTGSIIEHIPENYSGIILGSGFISSSSRKSFPYARIAAVRGKLTQERLGVSSENIKLGDPGLLASKLVKKREKKKYVLGVVPHYVDKSNTRLFDIVKASPNDCTIIDVERKNSLDVIRHIDQCENIISSSLHGLIVADSLQIPNAWVYSPGLTGGRFKFDDYYSSLDVLGENPMEIAGTETLGGLVCKSTIKPRDKIQELKDGLDKEFSSLRGYLR